MNTIAQPPTGGNGTDPPSALSPHTFVRLCEAREAFSELAAVAEDATRAPKQRKLTRRQARAQIKRARAALAWIFATPDPLAANVAPATSSGSRFEPWAE